MQFHHHGYVSGDPRVQPAAGVGLDRPDELPDEVDVLIVGAGPAGMIAAAQLSQFPEVTHPDRRAPRRAARDRAGGRHPGAQRRDLPGVRVRRADRRGGLPDHRDGFWEPDPADPARIVRGDRPADDPGGVSEFPHLIVNQARVLDYFAEYMANAPTRWRRTTATSSAASGGPTSHVDVTLVRTAGERAGQEKVVPREVRRGRRRCPQPGARRRSAAPWRATRRSTPGGSWTSWPSPTSPTSGIKCAIQSGARRQHPADPARGRVPVPHVRRPGRGRPPTRTTGVRSTTIEQIIAKANAILHPYTLDVRDVAWHSVYEVGHRLTDRFDDVPVDELGHPYPRVFIAGDACHTHSAKAGQGMNVSMQDGFNLAWKLGYVLAGRSPESLLATYSAERRWSRRTSSTSTRSGPRSWRRRRRSWATPAELARVLRARPPSSSPGS